MGVHEAGTCATPKNANQTKPKPTKTKPTRAIEDKSKAGHDQSVSSTSCYTPGVSVIALVITAAVGLAFSLTVAA